MMVSWQEQKTCTAMVDIFRYPTDPARDNGEAASACFQIHQSSSFGPERWTHKTIRRLHERRNILLQSVKIHPGCQMKLRAQLTEPFRLVTISYNPQDNALG